VQHEHDPGHGMDVEVDMNLDIDGT
jgi:hypothetical protein